MQLSLWIQSQVRDHEPTVMLSATHVLCVYVNLVVMTYLTLPHCWYDCSTVTQGFGMKVEVQHIHCQEVTLVFKCCHIACHQLEDMLRHCVMVLVYATAYVAGANALCDVLFVCR